MTTSERDGNASAPTAPASAGESAPAAPVVAGAAGSRGNDDGIVVRTARADDAPALAALSTELGYPADTVQIERRLSGVLAADDDVVFVAVARPDDVVGFVHALEKRLLVSEPYVELGGLIVASAARRRGAARLLIEAVERWTIARGVDLLRVRSGRTRRVADIAYRRCGFELEKEQRVFIKRLAGLRAPGAPS